MKILLAIDNSPYSKAAIAEVLAEFRSTDADVHILSVVDTGKLLPRMDGYGVHAMFVEEVATIMEQLRSEAEEAIALGIKKLSAAGFATKNVLREGEVKACILDYAEEWKPDLIILGSHGRKGFDRFLLGSVSEAILRHARCSVRVVRIGAQAETARLARTEEADVAHTERASAGRS